MGRFAPHHAAQLSQRGQKTRELANGVRLARLAYEGTSEVPEVTPGTGAGQVNASVSQVHVFFELGDHLGSTSVVLDKATSELVERSTFQSYGATESDYRPGRWNAFREDYKFTGKEEDAEVGLTYFGKRYLNAYLGRWISADPLAIHAPGEADLNVYAYVSGGILKNVDPLGLEEQTVDAANAGGASAADPAEHMGTGHEGASSDGSYLEATSDPEWQKGAGGALAGVALTGCAIASAGACAAGLVQFELTRQAIADTPASPGSQEAQNREIASDSNGAMLVAGATAKAAAPVAVAAGRAALAGARSVVAPWLREWAKKSGLFEKTSSIRTAASEAGEIGGSKPETGLIADVTVESRGEVLGRGTVDVRGTLERIKSGDLQPRDTFRNREGLLPSQPDGYYKEFYHPTPGYKGTGPERVIRGDGGEFFYTPNHYKSFIPLN